jgi:acyl dehydratase
MLYFEDIEVGRKDVSSAYTMTEEEIVSFSTKWDPFDFHTDQEYAADSIFEGLAASGMHTLCVANLLGHGTESWDVKAALSAEYKLPDPARVGDKLVLLRTVVSKRESKSRPEVGIIQHESTLENQQKIVVLELSVALFVGKREADT